MEPGLEGDGTTITVPQGHVYVVKQLTAYMSSDVDTVHVFFMNAGNGQTLWSCANPGGQAAWFGFYGALTFIPGMSFLFRTTSTLGHAADLYAGGYDLLMP